MKNLTKLQEPVLGLEGGPIAEAGKVITPAVIIGNSLMRSQAQDAIRADELAREIYHSSGSRFLIEDTDWQMALDAVNDDQLLTTLAKAAALRVLNGAVDAPKK